MIFIIVFLCLIIGLMMFFVASLMDEITQYRRTLTSLGNNDEIIRIKMRVMAGKS